MHQLKVLADQCVGKIAKKRLLMVKVVDLEESFLCNLEPVGTRYSISTSSATATKIGSTTSCNARVAVLSFFPKTLSKRHLPSPFEEQSIFNNGQAQPK
uniref:Uncharacterized protein n=1 Tax=Nelumbo nucifera TaxID=4432 RepID=A0A822XSL4_NELNU|nr:TPA_asm: hypothetical protein HUJ06_023542 [Nelumbo nucifera]